MKEFLATHLEHLTCILNFTKYKYFNTYWQPLGLYRQLTMPGRVVGDKSEREARKRYFATQACLPSLGGTYKYNHEHLKPHN
jgi:hypothetical protein